MTATRTTLNKLLNHVDLTETEAIELFLQLATDEQEPVMVAAVLAALRSKGETAEEIRGFALGMRQVATPQIISTDKKAVDIVGTGGDHSNSINISTGAALLTAALGQPVAKHGNRAVSGKTGSADVLEAMGLVFPQTPVEVVQQLDDTGFTFLFAPYFHPAMKYVAPIRKALGVRTVFNILGPLTNPAAPPYYVLGAFDVPTAKLMAEALSGMDMERGFVVHGTPGWDEATPCGPFTLFDVKPGSVTTETRDPLDAGIPRSDPKQLAGGDAAFNAAGIRGALAGSPGAVTDALAIGAALALEVTGNVQSFSEGVSVVREALNDGRTSNFLDNITTDQGRQEARSA